MLSTKLLLVGYVATLAAVWPACERVCAACSSVSPSAKQTEHVHAERADNDHRSRQPGDGSKHEEKHDREHDGDRQHQPRAATDIVWSNARMVPGAPVGTTAPTAWSTVGTPAGMVFGGALVTSPALMRWMRFGARRRCSEGQRAHQTRAGPNDAAEDGGGEHRRDQRRGARCARWRSVIPAIENAAGNGRRQRQHACGIGRSREQVPAVHARERRRWRSAGGECSDWPRAHRRSAARHSSYTASAFASTISAP